MDLVETHVAAATFVPPKPDRTQVVQVRGGHVWLRVNGDLKSPRAPVLMAHGGPGGDHAGFLPALSLAGDRAIIMWDQLDCGRSAHPQNPANWTVERFVSEIDAIRAALNVEHLHLLGHSWGATLALEYAARRPAGLKSVVLQGLAVSTTSWIADANALKASLPKAERETLELADLTGRRDTPAYRAAEATFRQLFISRSSPPRWWIEYQLANPQRPSDLCQTMWGPSEFTCFGTHKEYDGEWLLERVAAPTLVLVGEHDQARPATAKRFADRIPRADFKEIAGAAHVIQFDRMAEWVAEIGAWFRKWDRAEKN